MRDYIERNRLKTVIEKNFGHGTINPILQLIDEQPTADVVEVIRCKECKYRKFIDWGMGDCVHPKGSKHIAYDYHYCSYGERREDGE